MTVLKSNYTFKESNKFVKIKLYTSKESFISFLAKYTFNQKIYFNKITSYLGNRST